MTPLSRWKMDKEDEKQVRHVLVSELAKISTEKEMKELLNILLSNTEKLMIAKRVFVFVLIEQGDSDMEIARKLHFTRATVQRLRLNYEYQYELEKPVKQIVKGFEESVILKEILKKFLKYALPAAMGRIPR